MERSSCNPAVVKEREKQSGNSQGDGAEDGEDEEENRDEEQDEENGEQDDENEDDVDDEDEEDEEEEDGDDDKGRATATAPKAADNKTVECLVCGKIFPRGVLDLQRHMNAITLQVGKIFIFSLKNRELSPDACCSERINILINTRIILYLFPPSLPLVTASLFEVSCCGSHSFLHEMQDILPVRPALRATQDGILLCWLWLRIRF